MDRDSDRSPAAVVNRRLRVNDEANRCQRELTVVCALPHGDQAFDSNAVPSGTLLFGYHQTCWRPWPGDWYEMPDQQWMDEDVEELPAPGPPPTPHFSPVHY